MSESNIKHNMDKVREQLIAEYKEALHHKEIKDAVRELREKYAAIKTTWKDLSSQVLIQNWRLVYETY